MTTRQPDPSMTVRPDRIELNQAGDTVVLDDRQAAQLASQLAVATHVFTEEARYLDLDDDPQEMDPDV